MGVERGCNVAPDRDRPDFTVKCTKLHKSALSTNRPKLLLTDRNQDVYPCRKFVFSDHDPKTARTNGPPPILAAETAKRSVLATVLRENGSTTGEGHLQ
jgi:hypothetical protein